MFTVEFYSFFYQKENKVLSGVEVLIQTVNNGTSRRGELESKKGITERKIDDLQRQLKKTEGKTELDTGFEITACLPVVKQR